MARLFYKPIETLEADDVDELIQEAPPEGDEIDYKQQFPYKGRIGEDPWEKSETLNSYGKEALVKLVTALLNSHGGHVVLGIAETNDDPPRPGNVRPIPASAKLEERISRMLVDSIDPRPSGIETVAIPYPSGQDDTGVVVVRVPRSRLRPHRSTIDREAYLRLGKNVRQLSMRDIQDLSLYSRSSAREAQELLESRRINDQLPWGGEHLTSAAVRVTVLPVEGNLHLPRPYSFREELVPIHWHRGVANIDGRRTELLFPHQWHQVDNLRPILRGATRVYTRDVHRAELGTGNHIRSTVYTETILDNGLVELVYRGFMFEPGAEGIDKVSVAALIAGALWRADGVRILAGDPGAELAVEAEVRLWRTSQKNARDFDRSFILPQVTFHSPDFSDTVRTLYDDMNNLEGLAHTESFEMPSQGRVYGGKPTPPD